MSSVCFLKAILHTSSRGKSLNSHTIWWGNVIESLTFFACPCDILVWTRDAKPHRKKYHVALLFSFLGFVKFRHKVVRFDSLCWLVMVSLECCYVMLLSGLVCLGIRHLYFVSNKTQLWCQCVFLMMEAAFTHSMWILFCVGGLHVKIHWYYM